LRSATQADFVPLAELHGDDRHEIVQDGFGGVFRQVMPLRQFGGDMLQRDGGSRHGFRRCRLPGRCGGLFLGAQQL
jgi:hypothetical protein